MRIFISGSTGLVGKHISNILSSTKHKLFLPSHKEVDLLDYSSVLNYIQVNKPDLIIHCAGRVGGIQANINEPVKFLVENLDMGKNIIMAAREMKVKKLLNFGSSCMYPRHAPNPLIEEHILHGELEPTNEGYALAKISSQRLCKYVSLENPEFEYKTLIPCNLYGEFDKFDLIHAHMIPAAIHKVYSAKVKSENVEIWGSGKVRREFMYVGDLAEFILYCLDKFSELPDLLNVGTGKDYSIIEYYQAVATVIGFSGEFTYDLTKPEGMRQKLLDVEKLNNYGWHSKTDLLTGIEKTYSYYRTLIRK